MGRPKIKEELLVAANLGYDNLFKIIDGMTEKEFNTPFDFSKDEKKKEVHWKRDKNVKDILIHLYEWHQLIIKWVEENQKGNKASFLPKPYTFKTTSDMNIEFTKKHINTTHEESKDLFSNSHRKVVEIIESFSNEELFTKSYFSWTGTTSLGSYCISATSSHYDWAMKKIKAHKKICKG